jgi:MFS family permease
MDPKKLELASKLSGYKFVGTCTAGFFLGILLSALSVGIMKRFEWPEWIINFITGALLLLLIPASIFLIHNCLKLFYQSKTAEELRSIVESYQKRAADIESFNIILRSVNLWGILFAIMLLYTFNPSQATFEYYLKHSKTSENYVRDDCYLFSFYECKSGSLYLGILNNFIRLRDISKTNLPQ